MFIPVVSRENLPDPKGPLPSPTPQQIADFYQNLGFAFASWQLVETAIFTVYTLAIGTDRKNHLALSASFHSVANFRGRLQMTNEAVAHSTFPKEDKAEWATLSEQIRKKSLRRNSLVHGVVEFNTLETDPDRQLRLSDNPFAFYPIERVKRRGKHTFHKELSEMSRSFYLLQRKQLTFLLKIGKPLGKFEPVRPPSGGSGIPADHTHPLPSKPGA